MKLLSFLLNSYINRGIFEYNRDRPKLGAKTQFLVYSTENFLEKKIKEKKMGTFLYIIEFGLGLEPIFLFSLSLHIII